MNEVMFVTGGELLQFLPISSKKRVGMSICFFGHLKEEKYKCMQKYILNPRERIPNYFFLKNKVILSYMIGNIIHENSIKLT